MTAYYNEIDPYAAQWLRNLIDEGLIAPGDVDQRSIAEVRRRDLDGYTQCHFFAGIGGWSYALRLAGWPDERPVWTGSCPCQPFSVAGRQRGFDDARHLWPQWHRLIGQCRPAIVLGEQVANAPAWLVLVRSDLEKLDYAVGAIPIEAASAGADHLRDRYWFVADRDGERCQKPQPGHAGPECAAVAGSDLRMVANSLRAERRAVPQARRDDVDGHSGRQEASGGYGLHGQGDNPRPVADAAGNGWGEGFTPKELRRWGPAAAVASIGDRQIIQCPDGKWRRLPPPRVRWLGTRLPARISRVRAFGNAIDPRPAAAFIGAVL